MTRNITGGSAHKSQRNSEGSKARNNRELVDELLDDYRTGGDTSGVYVGRVLKRMGAGRMEVFYVNNDNKLLPVLKEQIIPMRGGLRGKGKKSVWVDIGSMIMIAETGLAGTTHEIVAVFTPTQMVSFKNMFPDAHPRLLQGGSPEQGTDELFEVDESAEVNVDAI